MKLNSSPKSASPMQNIEEDEFDEDFVLDEIASDSEEGAIDDQNDEEGNGK